jgi:hypothetical protein
VGSASKQFCAAEIDETGSKSGAMKPILLVAWPVFIDLVGFGLIIPVLPTDAPQLNAMADLVGLLMASNLAVQFFFTPFGHHCQIKSRYC